MKERPINLKAWEVQAIRAGRKTQFRRVVNPQPVMSNRCGIPFFPDGSPVDYRLCPYRADGDRLWVRETFRLFDCQQECACYDSCSCSQHHGKPVFRETYPDDEGPWRSPVCMPRWASRMTLEVVSVRVERMDEISEEDARAEGVERLANAPKFFHGYGKKGPNWHRTARESFESVWQSINGPGSWAENPWVWVVEFRQCK